jgi:hypothetical protein
VGDDRHFVFRQKTLGEDKIVRRGVVMVKHPGLFSPKFGATSSHVFTQLPQNVAVEPEIHSLAFWDKFFALPQLMYRWRHQSVIFWIPRRIPDEGRSHEAIYVSGKGHLACVSFAGGRAFPRRKNLFADDDRVRNDVQYLSHYKKNRDAAENSQASAGGKDNPRLLATRDNHRHSCSRPSHFVSALTNQLLGASPDGVPLSSL